LPKRKLFLLLHYLSPLNHTSQTKQADPGWWMEQSVNNHKFGKPDYIQPTPASQKLRVVGRAPVKFRLTKQRQTKNPNHGGFRRKPQFRQTTQQMNKHWASTGAQRLRRRSFTSYMIAAIFQEPLKEENTYTEVFLKEIRSHS